MPASKMHSALSVAKINTKNCLQGERANEREKKVGIKKKRVKKTERRWKEKRKERNNKNKVKKDGYCKGNVGWCFMAYQPLGLFNTKSCYKYDLQIDFVGNFIFKWVVRAHLFAYS